MPNISSPAMPQDTFSQATSLIQYTPSTSPVPEINTVNTPTTPASRRGARSGNQVYSRSTVKSSSQNQTMPAYQTSSYIPENNTPINFSSMGLDADMDREKVVQIIIYDKNNNKVTHSNFIINNIKESSQETVQVVQGFEQFQLLFFNPQVSSVVFGGFLINDNKYDQYNYFMNLYNSYLKGSVNALNQYTIYIKFFKNQYIKAAFVNLDMSISADIYDLIPMGFSVIILERYFETAITSSNPNPTIIITVDSQDAALRLQDPKLTNDEKLDIISSINSDFRTLFAGMTVNVIQATPTSIIVSFSYSGILSSDLSSGLTSSSNLIPNTTPNSNFGGY